jgi:Glycosyl hydrolase family 30 TIM-barrel domain
LSNESINFCFKFDFDRSYYSDEGIEYGIGRIPMAGTDFSTRTYSYDDVEGDVALSNFNLAEEDFVYKVILFIYLSIATSACVAI